MKILVVAGGRPADWPDLAINDYAYCVGVDRGSLYILQQGWPLPLAIGDFDSLTAAERCQVTQQAQEVIGSKPEKDDTDTQLALLTVFQRWPQAEVTLIGATGGRMDHLLANIWLGLEPRFQPHATQLVIADRQNELRYYFPGQHVVNKKAGMHYLAYCCLTPVNNLTLKRSKYLLDHVTVGVPTSYASNEFVEDTAEFSFDTGVIAVIQSRD